MTSSFGAGETEGNPLRGQTCKKVARMGHLKTARMGHLKTATVIAATGEYGVSGKEQPSIPVGYPYILLGVN